jgi:spermidine synthase
MDQRSNIEETLYDSYGQAFEIDEILFEERTDHQELIIFNNARLGRVMMLDGVVQTTEADEFIYHEMLAHTPIFAHGNAKSVLIIGGGDGGILREVIMHMGVEDIVMVEIDRSVVDRSREFLPNHSRGAFEDSRLDLVIDSGARYVEHSQKKFDVIITDSTDPIGPGEELFRARFYQQCAKLLNPGGILVTQNGVPFFQGEEMINTYQRMEGVFASRAFYFAAVPTYIGGGDGVWVCLR